MDTSDERRSDELRPVGDGGDGGAEQSRPDIHKHFPLPRVEFFHPDFPVPYGYGYPGGNLTGGRCERCRRLFPVAEIRIFHKHPNAETEDWPGNGDCPDTPTPGIISCLYCLLPDEVIQEFGAAALVVLDALSAQIADDLKDEGEHDHPATRECERGLDRARSALIFRHGSGSERSLKALSVTVKPVEFRRAYDLGRAAGIAEAHERNKATERREDFLVKGVMPDPVLAAHTLLGALGTYEGVRQVFCVVLPDKGELEYGSSLRVTVIYGPTAGSDFDDSALFLLEREMKLTDLETERLGSETVEQDVTPREPPASWVWKLAHEYARQYWYADGDGLKIYGRVMRRIEEAGGIKEVQAGKQPIVSLVVEEAKKLRAESQTNDGQ